MISLIPSNSPSFHMSTHFPSRSIEINRFPICSKVHAPYPCGHPCIAQTEIVGESPPESWRCFSLTSRSKPPHFSALDWPKGLSICPELIAGKPKDNDATVSFDAFWNLGEYLRCGLQFRFPASPHSVEYSTSLRLKAFLHLSRYLRYLATTYLKLDF